MKQIKEEIKKIGHITGDSFHHDSEPIYEAVQEGKKSVMEICDVFHLTDQINDMVRTMKLRDITMAVMMVYQQDHTEDKVAIGIIYKDKKMVVWNDSKPQRDMIYPSLKDNEIDVTCKQAAFSNNE